MKYLGFIIIAVSLSGCLVPLATGLKEIDSTEKGTKYTFITGADFHFGANGIDRVENKRGIKPKE